MKVSRIDPIKALMAYVKKKTNTATSGKKETKIPPGDINAVEDIGNTLTKAYTDNIFTKGYEKAKYNMQTQLESPGYRKRLIKEVKAGGGTKQEAEDLLEYRKANVNNSVIGADKTETNPNVMGNALYNSGHLLNEESRGKNLAAFNPNFKFSSTDGDPNDLAFRTGVEEFAHLSHGSLPTSAVTNKTYGNWPAKDDGKTKSPYRFKDNKNITQGAYDVLRQNASLQSDTPFKQNLINTLDGLPNRYSFNEGELVPITPGKTDSYGTYLGTPTEAIAKTGPRLRSLLMEEGKIGAGNKFRNKHFNYLLNNSSGTSRSALEIVTGNPLAVDAKGLKKGSKSYKKTRERLKNIINNIAG